MAEKKGVTVGFKVTADGSEAVKSVGSIKKELRDANQELLKAQEHFGDFSQEAIVAAKRVAELKDRIGDAKNFADAFNPDRKFQAFAGSVQGVVGGFTALTGVMGLVGVEGKEVEDALLKVQSALAISKGLDDIRESIDSFKALGTQIKSTTIFQKANAAATKITAVVTKALGMEVKATSTTFKVMKGAIAATGIGLLVLALGEAVSWLQSMGDAAEEAAEKQKTLEEQTVKLAKAGLEGSTTFIDQQEALDVARAKAAGKSEEEIFNIQQRWQKSRIKANYDYWDEVKNIDDEGQKAKEATEKEALKLTIDKLAYEAKVREDLKKKKEEADRKEKERLDALKKIHDEEIKEALRLKKELQQANDVNAAGSEVGGELAKLYDDYKEKAEILKKGEQDLTDLEIWYKSERKKIVDKFEADRAEEARQKLDEEKKRDEEAKAQQLERENAQLSAFKEAAQALVDNTNQSVESRRLSLDIAEQSMLDNATLSEHQRTEMERLFTDARIQLAEQERNAKVGFYQDIGGALGALSDLVGKQTIAGKALAIAQATINTWLGATEVLRTKSVLPEPMATISKVINVAAVVASGISAIRNIAKTNVGGGGSSVPSIDASAPLQPRAQATVTSLDRDSINAVGNGAVKAYTLESDITKNQEKVERINRAARIG
jgi:hypothetical protein